MQPDDTRASSSGPDQRARLIALAAAFGPVQIRQNEHPAIDIPRGGAGAFALQYRMGPDDEWRAVPNWSAPSAA